MLDLYITQYPMLHTYTDVYALKKQLKAVSYLLLVSIAIVIATTLRVSEDFEENWKVHTGK